MRAAWTEELLERSKKVQLQLKPIVQVRTSVSERVGVIWVATRVSLYESHTFEKVAAHSWHPAAKVLECPPSPRSEMYRQEEATALGQGAAVCVGADENGEEGKLDGRGNYGGSGALRNELQAREDRVGEANPQ